MPERVVRSHLALRVHEHRQLREQRRELADILLERLDFIEDRLDLAERLLGLQGRAALHGLLEDRPAVLLPHTPRL